MSVQEQRLDVVEIQYGFIIPLPSKKFPFYFAARFDGDPEGIMRLMRGTIEKIPTHTDAFK